VRIAGEEPGVGSLRDSWQVADQEVLRRIARRGFDRLAAYLGASGPAPESPRAPGDREGRTAVAATNPLVIPAASRVPMPPRRPQRTVSTPETAAGLLALAPPAR
jgi:hypothetical protein